MSAPMWVVKFAEGTALGRAMTDLEEDGYDPEHVLFCGARPVQRSGPTLVGSNEVQIAMIPMFMVAGRLKAHIPSLSIGTQTPHPLNPQGDE